MERRRAATPAPTLAIFSNHPEYKSYGQPDTPNATDNVVRGNVEAFTVKAERMSDRAMLASKLLVVS